MNYIRTPYLLKKKKALDGSFKYLWQFEDGALVESVYFIFKNLEDEKFKVACISTQVGCNVGCAFCASGRYKFRRNLTSIEIASQATGTMDDLRENVKMLDHVAFQGAGEPLLNFENVSKAAETILDNNFATSTSVATIGIPKYLPKLSSTRIKKLFISLHATDDKTREKLIPMNKVCNISELIKLAKNHAKSVAVPVTANYLILKGINDTRNDLERLKKLLDPKYFYIQLAILNPIKGINLFL